ncbi:MAG: Rpn family recombination-promoting nuclease/putative transposase [Proteobacteria bacterium]|jgi:predicted transposase/invertase (TIGR01784 family)|nr:Rpn family recombination-promoting nuclease/putative transposase [Pseudomonadota bacterium]BBB57765.1 transposase [Candidatus Megaera polyxenophila]
MALSKFLDPKNDVAFRKVFGSEQHKDIVIHFINDILELKGNDQIESVKFLSPMQDPEIASKKQSIVDVLCSAKDGVQIIVEMQVAPTKGFEKRAQYYAAKAYSRQLNKGNEEDGKYYNLKEVIFIAIANCVIFPDKKEYKSDHVILDKNSYEHNLKDFYFTFIELPKFKKNNITELKTIVDKWCYFFKHAPETSEEDLINIIGSDLIIEKAYNALNQFNWSETELIAYDEEIKRIRDNIAAMDYQYDKGRAEGIQEIALNLLRQNLPLDVISSATGLSHDELNELKSKL